MGMILRSLKSEQFSVNPQVVVAMVVAVAITVVVHAAHTITRACEAFLVAQVILLMEAREATRLT
jgi:hypothetical protein